jgi:hypothetical protein
MSRSLVFFVLQWKFGGSALKQTKAAVFHIIRNAVRVCRPKRLFEATTGVVETNKQRMRRSRLFALSRRGGLKIRNDFALNVDGLSLLVRS